MQKNRTVDEYIAKHAEWGAELKTLRQMVQATPLEETVKWLAARRPKGESH